MSGISNQERLSSASGWVAVREKVVEQALEDKDYEALRKISALPGGFGGEPMRRRVWCALLQTERYCRKEDRAEASNIELPPHKDENQVKLDSNRSFVVYPAGRKAAMQEDLHDLIVGVLRRYPQLSYFQGYHDILSVLYLTFNDVPPSKPRSVPSSPRGLSTASGTDVSVLSPSPDKTRSGTSGDWKSLRQCADVLSVMRVRDAMGSGMEGMMGMLRILKRILKVADPDLAGFSARISPIPTLPFFALSWILCLFSHDVDTLEPVQRMFDFLLARNPISALYLAVAILILKKPQMMNLAEKLGPEAAEDPSLLHPLFSRLPPLWPDTPDNPAAPPRPIQTLMQSDDDEPNPYDAIPLSDLFRLTDKLMAEFPWDGTDIRGEEFMGEGSVVYTYEREMIRESPDTSSGMEEAWGMSEALGMVDREVVRPGAAAMDDEEEELQAALPVRSLRRRPRIRRGWLLRLGRNKLGTTIALGVVLVGIGMAVSGAKAGGTQASWSRWWAVILGRKSSTYAALVKAPGGNLVRLVGGAPDTVRRAFRSLREDL